MTGSPRQDHSLDGLSPAPAETVTAVFETSSMIPTRLPLPCLAFAALLCAVTAAGAAETSTVRTHWSVRSVFDGFHGERSEQQDAPYGGDRVVVRGQSSDPFYSSDPFLQLPPGGSPAPLPQGGYPQGQITPVPAAPNYPGGYGPTAAPGMPAPGYGVNGAQPYRFGWQEAIDFALTSASSTDPNVGNFTWNEGNFEKQWVGQGPRGNILTISPQWNLRWIEGPTGPPGLAGDFHRLGLGFKLGTPVNPTGVSYEVGFNPAIASDFNESLTSAAWQFDGHVAAFIRRRPDLMYVLGVAYWDRVDDIFIPYAGVVWTPNDIFEVQLLFPKAKLELFLGTPYGVPTWTYLSGEYHVESYEVSYEAPGPASPSQSGMQISDYRIMGGVRFETGSVETFGELGVVFEREVEFERGGPDFDPDTALMGRLGIKF